MVKLKYDALGREDKRLIMETLVRLIDRSLDELDVEQKPTAYININYNKVENNNRVDIKVDLGEAIALLRDLKQLIYSWYSHGAIPRAAYGSVYGKLRKLEAIISRAN